MLVLAVNQSEVGYGISPQGIRLTKGYMDRICFSHVQIIVLCVEVSTLTPYHFREYVQSKSLLQIPNLLWNLGYHTPIPQVDMIDLAILE